MKLISQIMLLIAVCYMLYDKPNIPNYYVLAWILISQIISIQYADKPIKVYLEDCEGEE